MSNNEQHRAQYDAYERGYKEALLDVYLFLTGSEQVLDVDLEHFNLITAMTEQVTASSTGRLEAVHAT
jgi:hypothetical protein